ncbi:MAG: membrane protein insertase YidC [Chloroflexi bacterium]|nr:membrane protein insertase YidC [Chloroflexota bacterium]MCH9038415.1 membrane protein insertase YidC [Chloroflexota bacterium]MCI0770594.1 membrane protein insertase YidC [Chloroflexota bacterium]MCI0790401.1 membrane protein insertase YidC [Chloroflexota bacterium]MCI0795370.1 membrane protein insertase YidC [Chloroflexota bacterium]
MQILVDIWTIVIIQPMINSLVFLYIIFFSNFGVAIMAFTMVIRAIMIPLTVRQSRQLKKMSDLQPKLKAIQERHAKDRQKLSSETMRTYKENGVNPIGCLGPLVIQFPIWIGLFQAITRTLPSTPEKLVGLSQHLYTWLPGVQQVIPINNSFLWVDLSLPDPTPVMPVLVGLSMWVTQKMTMMPSADPRQAQTNKMMLWMMPLMFGFFTTTFPSGLAVYWIVSNVVGIVIQGFVTGWKPITDLLKFRGFGSKEAADETKAAPALVASAEETSTDENDRNNSQEPRRSNRNRPKGARRRARGSRNRRH